MKAFAEYLLSFASTPWGPLVLVLHAFLESFIMPIPHEFFLIPVALARPRLSFVFATLSTLASTFGIAVGYSIGFWGGRTFISKILNNKTFLLAKQLIHRYDAWAVALACFTPFPDKVFAQVAGLMHLHFKKMMVIAFLSRGLRFFLVSTLLYFYGEPIKHWIVNYLGPVMIVIP